MFSEPIQKQEKGKKADKKQTKLAELSTKKSIFALLLNAVIKGVY